MMYVCVRKNTWKHAGTKHGNKRTQPDRWLDRGRTSKIDGRCDRQTRTAEKHEGAREQRSTGTGQGRMRRRRGDGKEKEKIRRG